jgi:hypothetical protein
MKTVKAVEYIDGYRLKLLFDDKKTKIVDLTDVVKKGGHYFKPLQDIELFKQVSLDDDEYPSSIRWPNDADICPDVLYKMGRNVREEPQKTTKARQRKRVAIVAHAMTKKRSKNGSSSDSAYKAR